MTKDLNLICEEERGTINRTYDLGHGDAVELFRFIWEKMTAGPNSKQIQAAVDLVADTFNI